MKISCNEHMVSYDGPEGKYKANLEKKITLEPGSWTFVYDYPLSKEARFPHDLPAETTGHELLLLAKKDYKRIYREEDEAVGDPGNVPGMLNRARSEGPWGIWGHGISDLFFECVDINPVKKTIEFGMGS